MLRIGLINPDLNVNIGPKVVNILHIEPGGQATSPENLENLTVPWRNLQEHPDVLSFLSWHTQISEFHGRDPEMAELERWATEATQAVSVKFVTGDGGVGKSRLAGQFATQMQGKKWAAGFVDLRRPGAFPVTEEGTLLVVDYPEENREGVTEFLTDLSNLDLSHRLRVLFLSRRTIDDWQDVIECGNAVDLVDRMPVVVGSIDGPASYELFCSAQERAAEQCKTTPLPLSEVALTHWLERAPENDRALFIVALAVHSAFHPKEEVVRYTGREVLEALVRRELVRLRRSAKKAGTDHPLAFARLLAMAAIADRIPVGRAVEFAKNEELQLGFPQQGNIHAMIAGAEIASESEIRAPKPDIVAAAFTVTVLAEEPDTAPEIVWAALEPDVEGGLRRLERLSYDAEIVLGMGEHCLSKWLAEAIKGKPERCRLLEAPFAGTQLPLGWLDAAVNLWQTMLECVDDEPTKARILNNLAADLAAGGDIDGALTAIHKAVEIYHRLAKTDPTRFEGELGGSLNNLWGLLTDTGDDDRALEAIREAVEIHDRLADKDPSQFESGLAMSLNNLSCSLGDKGNLDGALKANQKAVEIYRRLARDDPAQYNRDLAASISNLAGKLSDIGDDKGALDAIKEAVDINRSLAEANPARYEPDLALSLNNLSLRSSDTGDHEGALEAVQKSVEIRRRLAKANPARFEPELATSLRSLGLVLCAGEQPEKAMQAFSQAIEIIEPHATGLPEGSPANLLSALEADLKRTQETMRDGEVE